MTKTRFPPREAAAPDARKPSRRFGAAMVALATALLALASASLGLMFDIKPDLRPDPRTEMSADVSVFAVERKVALDNWLRRTTPSERAYRVRRDRLIASVFRDGPAPSADEIREQLAVTGQLFYVKTKIVGFKRRTLRLRWSMYGVRSQQRLPAEGLADFTSGEIIGQAPSDSSVSLVWTPEVVVRGECFARFEIVDPNGVVLAVADSQKFPGLIS